MRINIFKQSIKQASIFIAVITVISQLTGLIRESLIASKFGTGEELDILLLALAIPWMISNIMFMAIPNAGIPHLQRMNTAAADNKKLPLGFLKINTVIVFITAIVVYACLPYFRNLIAPGLNIEQADKLVKFGRIFCLLIPLKAYEGIFRSLLHIKHHFFFPALTNLAMNIVFIAILITLFPSYSNGAYLVAWLSSVLVQMVLVSIPWLLVFAKMKDNDQEGYFDYSGYSKLFSGIISVEVLGLIIQPFDRYLAGLYLETGFVSALNYADIIQSVPLRALIFSMGAAIFPSLSEKASMNDIRSLSILYRKSLAVCVFLIIPISLYGFLYRNEIVSLLLERGRFDATSTAKTTDVLQYYFFGMIMPAFLYVQARVLYSLKKWKEQAVAKLLGFTIKALIGFTFILTDWAIAIAVGTISMYVFCFISLELYLKVKIGIKYYRESFILMGKALIGSIIISSIIFLCWIVLIDILNYLVVMIITAIAGGLCAIVIEMKMKITGMDLAKYLKLSN